MRKSRFSEDLGAARDYLGALIAHRIGLDPENIDSMARLVGQLREAALPDDALLELLFATGCISAHPKKPGKYTVAGWVQELSAIRNELVHKRPYGSKWTLLMKVETSCDRILIAGGTNVEAEWEQGPAV